ncbi:MAG: hypothetical protein DWI49_03875 [Chloroflexi bacterium]|jgi:hypothetical protein|nr:MAG: hypothetical protein DWI46_00505 [Chloroflexota bacterium]RLT26551.1 MAG: hypothetical protein DWI49_03875 [Chloroflexota bacterium]
MSADAIFLSLSYINWVVVSALAVGSHAAVLLLTYRSTSTRGYRGFTVFAAGGWAFLAWLADGALPSPAAGSPIQAAGADLDALRRLLLVCVASLATLWMLRIARGSDGRVIGVVTVGTGAAALLVAAVGWAPSVGIAIALALQLLLLAAVTGGAFAAMVLAHWYLVTPKLPEAPLLLVSRTLGIGVALQIALFFAWHLVGLGGFGSGWDFFAVLRLVIGLLFPAALTYGGWRTARVRSMESATGLLYIDLGAVATGTILAAGLFFGAGILV